MSKRTLKLNETQNLNSQVSETTGNNPNANIDITLELLSGSWISDLTLQKYFEILNSRFLFVNLCFILNPLISHAVKCVEDFRHFLDPLEIEAKNVLFVPVNDAQDVEAPNGSHWSLLIYFKPGNTFYYYDSMSMKSLPSAIVMANKLGCYFTGNGQADFVLITGPQQHNGYDCGIFVCYVLEALVFTSMTTATLDFSFIDRLQLTKNKLIKKRSLLAYVLVNSVKLNDDDLFSLLFEDFSTKPKLMKSFTVLKEKFQLLKPPTSKID